MLYALGSPLFYFVVHFLFVLKFFVLAKCLYLWTLFTNRTRCKGKDKILTYKNKWIKL